LQEADAGTQAADASRMRDVMSRCGALGSERPRATFKTNNLEQDLTRLLKSGNVEQHRDVLERKLASSALAGTWLDLLLHPYPVSFLNSSADNKHSYQPVPCCSRCTHDSKSAFVARISAWSCTLCFSQHPSN